ncbi:uncharacterized protein At3g17950-like [Mercurialis annua]|uniref:uncharacterized protein At3g17950-like n=1 Tax=Mercurialis annua TaxID=3986 RepID=UPI00215E0FA1|nr:uncharacterized protein At3g17950-like [Mercurialis annua]
MSQQEEGWPLGLQPLNERVGIPRNNVADFSGGSVSFNTLITASSSSSPDSSSSDLDTESTGSFFHDRSITLGSLIGVSNLFEFSRKSSKVRKIEVIKAKKSNKKRKTWLFSLCSRDTTDAQTVTNNDDNNNNNNNHPPSLGHFLAAERRAAADEDRRNQNPNSSIYGADEFSFAEANSLFVDGQVAPPRVISAWHEEDEQRTRNGEPVLFSCICG